MSLTGGIGFLTEAEHAAVDALGHAWGLVVAVINEGGNPETFDTHELVGHVHALQNAVLANAAARAYPETYRLLGGTRRTSPESEFPAAGDAAFWKGLPAGTVVTYERGEVASTKQDDGDWVVRWADGRSDASQRVTFLHPFNVTGIERP